MKAVLTYHSIDDSRSPISVSADRWRAHLRWLTGGRVRVLSLADLSAHAADGEDAVAVTFDDGFANSEAALSACAMEALPVSVFVVSGHVGRTNAWGGRTQAGIPTLPLLDWRALQHLATAGVSIECHTATHPALTRLSGDALAAELEGSRDEIRAKLGVPSEHVAYPYGDVDRNVEARAATSFRYGYSTDFRPLGPADSLMRLPRLDMYYFRAPGALEAWGSGAFRRRLATIRLRRAIRARAVGVLTGVR